MAIDKLTPRYLNMDDDERLVQSMEMTDAYNVRSSIDGANSSGVLKNIKGTTEILPNAVSDAIPATGTNKVIGSCTVDVDGVVYYFLHNTSGQHGIYVYSSSLGKYQKILQNSALAFSADSHVQAEVVINSLGEHLLYFTDNINEPRKINATKALLNLYDANLNAVGNDEFACNVDVCVSQPLDPPTYLVQTNSSLKYNNVIGRPFQFASQILYNDGEVSAIGPYSKIVLSPAHYQVTGVPTANELQSYNQILVQQSLLGYGEVRAVRFLYREGNVGLWKVIDEINVYPGSTDSSVVFTNRGNYAFVPEQEANKLYDAVPIAAKAICVSNNRLFMGNYLESREPISLSAQFFPQYKDYDAAGFQDVKDAATLNGANTSTNIIEQLFLSGVGDPAGEFARDYQLGDVQTYNTEGGETISNWDFYDGGSKEMLGGRYESEVYFQIDLNDIIFTNFPQGGSVAANLRITPDRVLMYPVDEDGKIGTGFNEYNSVLVTTGPFGFPITLSDSFEGFIYAGYNENLDNTFANGGGGVNSRACGASIVGLNSNVDFNAQIPINPGESLTEVGQNIAAGLIGKTATATAYTRTVMHGPTFTVAAGYFSNEIGDSVAARYSMEGNTELTFQITGAVFGSSSKVVTGVIQVVKQEFSGVYGVYHGGPKWRHATSAALGGLNDSNTVNNGSQTYDQYVGSINFNKEIVTGNLTDSVAKAAGSYDVGGVVLISTIDQDEEIPVNRPTFKSGSTHSFGAVCYDIHNRPTTVTPLGDFYVPHFGESSRPTQGPLDLAVKITGEYPDWVKRVQLVYSGSNDIEDCLNINVAEALTADATKLFIKDPAFSGVDSVTGELITPQIIPQVYGAGNPNNLLFLSARNFEGKAQSYIDSSGAKISYEFRPGDKARIVSYQWGGTTGQGYTFPSNYEYEIVGYKYFDGNDKDNPLLIPGADVASGENDNDANQYRKSGWFLILDGSPEYTGFKMSDVRQGNSRWGRDLTLQIIRPKKVVDDEARVYYEIGEAVEPAYVGGGTDYDSPMIFYPYASPAEDIYNENAQRLFFMTNQVLVPGDEVSLTRIITPVGTGGTGFNTPESFVTTNGNTLQYLTPNLNAIPQISFNIDSLYLTGNRSTLGYSASDYNTPWPFSNTEDVFVYRVNSYFEAILDSYEYGGDGSGADKLAGFAPPNTSLFGIEANVVPSGNPALTTTQFVLKNQGDAFFRNRNFVTNAFSSQSNAWLDGDIEQYKTQTKSIEEFTYNDFIDKDVARSWHKGRPHFYDPSARATRRHSSITYSDSYASDGKVLSLSSFNPSLFPYKDMPLSNGGITYLEDRDEAILSLQERKAAIIPVGRQLIEAGADGFLATSTNVMGTERFMAGDYGPGKDSKAIVPFFGRTYFVDKENGKVVQLGGDGITLISDNKVDSFFERALGKISTLPGFTAVLGIDPEYDEMLVCIPDVQYTRLTIDGEDFSRDMKTYAGDASLVDISGLIRVETSDASPLNVSAEAQQWDAHLLNWEDVGNGILIADHPYAIGYIDAYLGTTGRKNIIVTDSRNTFFGKMDSDLAKMTGDIAASGYRGGAATIEKSIGSQDNGLSMGYNFKWNLWMSKYSFVPELFTRLHERLMAFKDGVLYTHNTNTTRNNLYGVQYDSTLTVISKINPSMIKAFTAMSLETNVANWAVALSNSYQATEITESMWSEQDIDGNADIKSAFREGMLYCEIPGDEATSQMHRVPLGVVEAVDGTSITMSSKISSLPFNLGDVVYKVSGSGFVTVGGTVSSIDARDTFTVSGGTIVAGDTLMIAPSNLVSAGDPIRDYYLKLVLTNDSTKGMELYAINTNFTRSFLHDEKVN